MTPVLVTLFIASVFVAVTTLVVGIFFVAASHLTNANMPASRSFFSGFAVAVVCGGVYGGVLRLMDDTTQPVLNAAFFAAALAGAATAFVVVMKTFDVEMRKVPVVWLMAIIALLPLMYLQRTTGNEFREAQGFFRGYESIWSMNLPDPPDAMSTPERAVAYYNVQYAMLRRANEDDGMGKILTTASHRDLHWFNQQYEVIMTKLGEGDVIGATKIITSPHARKGMALGALVRPIVGEIKEVVRVGGNDALVQMDSGQLVHLTREGRNWKIRDWLGMRTHMMNDLRPLKEREPRLMAREDELWYANEAEAYNQSLRQLCETAGLAYAPFNPNLGMEEDTRPGMALLGGTRRPGSEPENPALAGAAPGTLVDLSAQPTPAPAPVAQAAPTQPGPTPAMTPLPQTPPPVVAQVPPPASEAAMLAPPDPQQERPTLIGVQAARDAVDISNQQAAMRADVDPTVAGMTEQPGQPHAVPQAGPGPLVIDPQDVPAMSMMMPVFTPTPQPVVIPNAPVEPLWVRYSSFMTKLDENDPAALTDLRMMVTNDDFQWFDANAELMAAILTPDVQYSDPAQARMVALRALARNMPPNVEGAPQARTPPTGFGVARIRATGPASEREEYFTPLVQENGRWVMARFFFARDFVWTPLLSMYKQQKNIAPGPDEQLYRSAGLAPFQDKARQALQIGGFATK